MHIQPGELAANGCLLDCFSQTFRVLKPGHGHICPTQLTHRMRVTACHQEFAVFQRDSIGFLVIFIPPAACVKDLQRVNLRQDLLQRLCCPPASERIVRVRHADESALPAQAPHHLDRRQTLGNLLRHEIAQQFTLGRFNFLRHNHAFRIKLIGF